jgi:predicted nuclease with RNAse H fold
MPIINKTFVGIDPSGGRHTFTFAALDEDCQLVTLASGELEELFAFLRGLKATVTAVNAPHSTNQGLVRRMMEEKDSIPGHLRGSDLRMAEYKLRERGISISPTPSRTEACAAWMQTGFNLYKELEDAGYKPYPSEDAVNQWMETQPHAAFCALIGQNLLPKPTLEGRLQRQLALYERGININDPMSYFEEITRHRLLKGILPTESIYSAEELDALVAAFAAYLASNHPEEVNWVGDIQEGRIFLPVSEIRHEISKTGS